MGWLIALAIVVALGCIPIGVRAKYDTKGAEVVFFVGPFRKALGAKKKQPDQKAPKKEASAEKESTASDGDKKGGSLSEFYPLVVPVWELLKHFRRKLRVKYLELKVILAGDDPCDLAVNYGRACGALAALEPQLDRFFVIRKREVQVECDFAAERTLIFARAELSITVARLLHIGFYHGARILKLWLKILKSRKGGIVQ